VIRLSNELAQIWTNIRHDRWEEMLTHQPASYKKLGELQSAYQIFIATFLQLNGYLKNGMYVQKKKLLYLELKNLTELKQNLLKQQEVYQQDFVIATQDFGIKQKLYELKAISLVEYKQEESKYLSKKLPVETIELSIINNNNAIANKEQELIQLELKFTDEKSNFLQALNTLISNTDEWKTKYLLTSPLAGTIAWPALLQEKQDVEVGQELFYIIPPAAGYYGEIVVPQESFGKLRLQQQVLISLAGFPYQEFGKLKGVISFISDIPDKEKQYHVGVLLQNGLETDRNYTIKYSNGLIGTAEVITSKTRLINKFLYTIREIINKPKVIRSDKKAAPVSE
jgi:HlyD family secretion protein